MTWLDVLDELGRENLRLMPRRPSVPWINAVWKVNGPTHRRRPHVKLISVRVTIGDRSPIGHRDDSAPSTWPRHPSRGNRRGADHAARHADAGIYWRPVRSHYRRGVSR